MTNTAPCCGFPDACTSLGAGLGSRWPDTYWSSVALADKAENLWMYTDSGDKLFIDSRQSSDYIRPLGRLDLSPLHNLEVSRGQQSLVR